MRAPQAVADGSAVAAQGEPAGAMHVVLRGALRATVEVACR